MKSLDASGPSSQAERKLIISTYNTIITTILQARKKSYRSGRVRVQLKSVACAALDGGMQRAVCDCTGELHIVQPREGRPEDVLASVGGNRLSRLSGN